ncbi:MAG TPA: hypothetical protein ENH99_02980 [Candidatus Pacearchaeota archaeon]|nr:hypothetical protein [Candidatus Pacearchaeota archaeon]
MRLNFRKISALATSALMIGMTAGVAVAANYPAPFVVGGTANAAIVYGTGTGVSALDLVQAGNIQSNLQSFMGASSSGTSTSTSGETVSLDTSADRIWMNTSLDSVKSTITKSDLPTVLKDYSFSGDVTSKVTSSIKLIAGKAAGAVNSGKVIFAKQPSSSDDPVIGISIGTSQTAQPLYNATATMSAINFTSSDSEGEEIVLFGQAFTVASETTGTNLILLKDAAKVDLTSDSPTATVTVSDEQYTIELVSASDTAATIKVTNSAGESSSKEINEASSKRVNGIDVAVTNADETNLRLSATVTAGADKLTLTTGSIVTVGESDDPIDGTYAYILGGNTNNDNPVNSTTEITISVFRKDGSNDVILPGESFLDPVFGSFKVDFAGLSSPLDDANRETIAITTAGDDTMSILFTEQGGFERSFDFAHNESSVWKLGTDDNFSVATFEMANLSYASNIGSGGLSTVDDGASKYVVVGNEDYGHLLELYDVYNQTAGSSAITNDRVKFRDHFTREAYETTFTSTEGVGTMDVDGKRYTVYFNGTGENAYVQIKYPTSESAVNQYVVFPTIETANGALVQFYQPTILNLTDMNSSMGRNDGIVGTEGAAQILNVPDGDGYTAITLTAYNSGTGAWNVSANSTHALNTNETAADDNGVYSNTNMTFTIGTIKYQLTSIGVTNLTQITIVDPEGGSDMIDQPAVIIYEAKDDDTNYHVIVVDLEGNAASMGSSTNGVGVNDVLFSSDKYHDSATRASDSDFTEDFDWWGALVTTDASDSDQKTVTISYPKNQVYSQIYIGASDSLVSSTTSTSGAASLGDVIVMDSEVSSVSSKNLVVVGGSCINSAAANLLGGASCGSAWTDATGVGSGQFLIQSFGDAYSTGKVALLVAGYEAADTVNAAIYLRTQTVDTTASKKYIGTSSTSAELQVA